ncbi:MAG: fibronectin type III-like domain-contianing protein [Bacteroidales bacterium]|nr:fibronectin type III-like domain-contianing protein [Bacteroidales bacterium]
MTLEIPVEDLRYWDIDTGQWQLENGKIELLLGKSSQEIVSKLSVEI